MIKLKLPNDQTLVLTYEYMEESAKWVINQVFKKNEYSPDGFEIKKDDTVIDIGANTGIFSLFAAHNAPAGKIIAIEPTSIIECLELSIKENNLSNIEVIKAAIGKDGEKLELTTFPLFNILNHQKNVQQPWFTRLIVFINIILFYRHLLKYSEQENEIVSCISLDKIIEKMNIAKIDFLKIDCEGAEYDLFRTLSDNSFSKIEKIILEFHHFRKDHHYNELVEILELKGFKVQVIKRFYEYYGYKIGSIYAKRN